MSNQQGPQNSAHALSTLSSFEELKTPYPGREAYAVHELAIPVVKMNPRIRQQQPQGPDAIWGHYNNCRSSGLAGSAAVHVVWLALIIWWFNVWPPRGVPRRATRDRDLDRSLAGFLCSSRCEESSERWWRRR
jgi:hypothetical protein